MLTSVQKEILQTLINLYQSSEGKSIKGEDIAEVMNRNPGTIRNQMQSLRSLSLVKGVPGPRGGYKPTIEAYHSLNISISDKETKVPIYCNDERLNDISVAKIEFTSVPQPGECEAAVKVLGSIKDLNLGDLIRIGPTPVNNLGIMGKIVGRDDMDNILLVDTTTIRSIPKLTVGDIASKNVISLKADCNLKEMYRFWKKYNQRTFLYTTDKNHENLILYNFLENRKVEAGPVKHLFCNTEFANGKYLKLRYSGVDEKKTIFYDKDLNKLDYEPTGYVTLINDEWVLVDKSSCSYNCNNDFYISNILTGEEKKINILITEENRGLSLNGNSLVSRYVVSADGIMTVNDNKLELYRFN